MMLPENVYRILYDQCAYDMPFLLYERTQAPKLHKLRDLHGADCSGRVPDPEARLACGSMVRFILFHKKIHFVNFFVKKIRVLPPCRRRYPPQNTGLPDTCQHWPFRGFRSCRGVRGPNSHRVTCVNYILPICRFWSAVAMLPRCRCGPDSVYNCCIDQYN